MAKLTAAKWPRLNEAWNDYGHVINWDNLFDAKVRNDASYAVLAWKNDDGMIEVADLARGHGDWEMLNDGSEPMTLKQWKGLKIVPDCDWYELPKA